MKKVQIKTIQEKTNGELIDDLNNCRYSLLDSLGCKKLRLEMFIPGIVSAIIVRYLVWKAKRKSGNNWTTAVRSYLIKLFKKRAPYELVDGDKLPVNAGGIIIGFNHPSLGEILRLVALVSKHYPYDNYLFPVNLPWYEALCPVVGKMEEAGFKLTPIMTPSTRVKIEKTAGKETLKIAEKIGAGFNSTYMKLCRQFIQNGDIIVVAPSATRQRFIYKNDEELCEKTRIEPSTMSLLASMFARDNLKESNAKFLPIAVKPPSGYQRGLNLSGTYVFGVCEPFSVQEALELSKEKYGDFNGRKFDHLFLARISIKMFHMGNYQMIAPFKHDSSIDGLAKIMEESKDLAAL